MAAVTVKKFPAHYPDNAITEIQKLDSASIVSTFATKEWIFVVHTT